MDIYRSAKALRSNNGIPVPIGAAVPEERTHGPGFNDNESEENTMSKDELADLLKRTNLLIELRKARKDYLAMNPVVPTSLPDYLLKKCVYTPLYANLAHATSSGSGDLGYATCQSNGIYFIPPVVAEVVEPNVCAFDSASICFLACPLKQGTGDGFRVGNRINIRKLEVTVPITNGRCSVDVLLVRDCQPNNPPYAMVSSTPGYAGTLYNASSNPCVVRNCYTFTDGWKRTDSGGAQMATIDNYPTSVLTSTDYCDLWGFFEDLFEKEYFYNNVSSTSSSHGKWGVDSKTQAVNWVSRGGFAGSALNHYRCGQNIFFGRPIDSNLRDRFKVLYRRAFNLDSKSVTSTCSISLSDLDIPVVYSGDSISSNAVYCILLFNNVTADPPYVKAVDASHLVEKDAYISSQVVSTCFYSDC